MKLTRLRVAAVAALIAAVGAGLTGCAPSQPTDSAKSAVAAYLDAAKSKNPDGIVKATSTHLVSGQPKYAADAVLDKIDPIESYEITDVRPMAQKALVRVTYKVAGKTYKTSLNAVDEGTADKPGWYVDESLPKVNVYSGKFTAKIGSTIITDPVIAVPGKVKVTFTDKAGYYKPVSKTATIALGASDGNPVTFTPELSAKGEQVISSLVQGYLSTYNGGWYYGGTSFLDERGFSYLAQKAAGGEDSGPYKLITAPTIGEMIRIENGSTQEYRVTLTGGHWGVITRVAKTGNWSDPYKFDYVDKGNTVTSVTVNETPEGSFEVESVEEDTSQVNEGDLQ